jgi:hypothetical protein
MNSATINRFNAMNRMLGFVIVLALNYCLASGDTVAASMSEDNSVVSIWSDSGSGSGWTGSGCIFARDGMVLTSYHLIRAAVKLTVYVGKKAYNDIEVIGIAPQYDLAVLKVKHLSNEDSILPLRKVELAEFSAVQLRVLGVASTQMLQQSIAHLELSEGVSSADTQDSATRHSASPGSEPAAVLARFSTFDGATGAPVIADGEVIGIVGGTSSTGHDSAWIIPAKFATEENMTPIRMPIAQVTIWPELSPFSKRWNGLRRRYSLSTKMSEALNNYFSSIDSIETKSDELAEAVERVSAQMVEFIHTAEALSDNNPTMPIEDRVKQIDQSEERVSSALDNFVKKGEMLAGSMNDLAAQFGILRTEISRFLKSLPPTKLNKERAKKIRDEFSILNHIAAKNLFAFGATIVDFEHKFHKSHRELLKAKDLGTVLQLYERQRKELTDYYLGTQKSRMDSTLESLRDIGTVPEALLNWQAQSNAPQDAL